MRIFLDASASVWVAALLSATGGSSALLEEISARSLTALITPQTIREVIRNLQEKSTTDKIAHFLAWCSVLRPDKIRPPAKSITKARRVINRKDAIILAAAIKGKSDILVTLDRKHFLIDSVKKFAEPTQILTPGEALAKIRS